MQNHLTDGNARPVGRRVLLAAIALAAVAAGCGASPGASPNAGPDGAPTREPTVGFSADKQHDMFFEKGGVNEGYPAPAYGRPEGADDDW